MARRNGFIATDSGWRAWVRVGQTLKTKRFPRNTTEADIQRWREDARQKLRSSPAHRLHAMSNGRWGKGLRVSRIPRSEHGWCYVYFVQSGNFIKIGSAIDIKQRLASIRTSSPGRLTLLATFPAHRNLELALHTHFWRDRVRAEWYTASDEMRTFIAKARAGWNPLLLLMGENAMNAIVDPDWAASPAETSREDL